MKKKSNEVIVWGLKGNGVVYLQTIRSERAGCKLILDTTPGFRDAGYEIVKLKLVECR